MGSDKHQSPSSIITFKDLPEGTIYFPTFRKRVINPLLKAFENKTDKFIEACYRLNGIPASKGDVASYFQVLPRIGMTFVMWNGDSELPGEGTVLFTKDIINYLPIEDITVLCQILTQKLSE